MHLVELCIYNALMMRRFHSPKTPYLQFRLNLVSAMIAMTGGTNSTPSVMSALPLRLTERHFMEKIPATTTGKPGKRRCKVCAQRKRENKLPLGEKAKRTTRWCPDCQVPLCDVPCFKIFHSKSNFSS